MLAELQHCRKMLQKIRPLTDQARVFNPMPGSMFGGQESTKQDKSLANAVDHLSIVLDAILDHIISKDKEDT